MTGKLIIKSPDSISPILLRVTTAVDELPVSISKFKEEGVAVISGVSGLEMKIKKILILRNLKIENESKK